MVDKQLARHVMIIICVVDNYNLGLRR